MLERIFAADIVRGAVPPWMRHDSREILRAVRRGSSYNAPGKRPGGVGQEALHALGDFLERLDVRQLDIAAGLEPDLAVVLHDGEGPAHDLGGEAEMAPRDPAVSPGFARCLRVRRASLLPAAAICIAFYPAVAWCLVLRTSSVYPVLIAA